MDENAEEVGYEDDLNASFPEDLTLSMPSYIGAFSLKEAGLGDLVKEEVLHPRSYLGARALLYFYSASMCTTSDERGMW